MCMSPAVQSFNEEYIHIYKHKACIDMCFNLQNSVELLLLAGVNAATSFSYAVTGFSKYLRQNCSNLLHGV